MATSRSNLGQAGASVPKSGKQGGNKSAPTKKPVTSGTPGGFGKNPGNIAQPKRTGVRATPKGGSGTGGNKGDRLPR